MDFFNNLDQVSLIINIVGTLVIIISLLYLAKQTRLTNKIAAGESERELFDSFNEIVFNYSKPEDVELLQRAFANYETLSYVEKARFNMIYLIPHINNFESFYRMNQLDMMADVRVERTANLVVSILRTAGGKEAWKELQYAYNPKVVAYIDRIAATSQVLPMNELFHWYQVEKK